ncbi:MAG: hypothetical protein HQ518_30280 [Rhodopirellula sp.]|nr:hypothetical protein [Rhodopirellula sp.]
MDEKREVLDGIARAIGGSLARADRFQASFLIRRYIDQFLSGLYFLATFVEEHQAADEANWKRNACNDEKRVLRLSLRRLCGLSRDLSLAMDADGTPQDLRENVGAAKDFVVLLVGAELPDEEADRHLKNIVDRQFV